MTKFKITYDDPEGNPEGYIAHVVEYKEFEDSVFEGELTTVTISAREWAEDYAYAKANKGQFKVEEDI